MLTRAFNYNTSKFKNQHVSNIIWKALLGNFNLSNFIRSFDRYMNEDLLGKHSRSQIRLEAY
jgi:hypothetical protein